MPYQVEIIGLRDLLGRFSAMIGGELLEIQMAESEGLATVIEDVFRRHAPRSRGTSRDKPRHFYEGIEARAKMGAGGFGIDVTTDDPLLRRWLSMGTAPHVIRPVEKRALWWPTARHPVKLVHHPGTQANPWEVLAYVEVRPLVLKVGNTIGHRVVQGLAGT